MERYCIVCGENISNKNKHAKYCSKQCWRRDNSTTYKPVLYCKQCGKEFERKTASGPAPEYCSRYCKYKYFYIPPEPKQFIKYQIKNCISCGKEFINVNSKFCGKECSAEYMKQKQRQDAIKKRTKEKRTREQSNTWEYREWRNSVYKRDNYQCQVCGDNKGKNLRAHHLENYWSHEDIRYSVKNGITLCEDCHKTFHRKYGLKYNNKEQYGEFKNEYSANTRENFLKAVPS